MSTHFDGVNSTKLLVEADPLIATNPASDEGQSVAMLWKPNEVAAGGLVKVGPGDASVNPYLDGRIYYAAINGGFLHSGSGGGAGTPGEFYTATDGWRFDCFTCRLNTSNTNQVLVRRHTFFYNTGVWTHVELGALTNTTAIFSDPVRVGSFTDVEANDMLVAALAVWSTGNDIDDAEVETMLDGLYAWDALNPTMLLDLEDAGTKNIDPRGDGATLISITGGSYSGDEPFGWTYSLTPPSSGGVSNPLKVRRGGTLVSSTLEGFVRYGGLLVPFGANVDSVEGDSIFGSVVPATQFDDGGNGVTTATLFIPDVDGTITHLRAIGWDGSPGSIAKGGLWNLTSQTVGTLIGETDVFDATSSGPLQPGRYKTVPLQTPVHVTANLPYQIGVWQSDGRYWSGPAGYLNTPRGNGHLLAPGTEDIVSFPVGGDAGARNGRFLLNSTFGFATDTSGGGCYFVDVIFVPD